MNFISTILLFIISLYDVSLDNPLADCITFKLDKLGNKKYGLLKSNTINLIIKFTVSPEDNSTEYSNL